MRAGFPTGRALSASTTNSEKSRSAVVCCYLPILSILYFGKFSLGNIDGVTRDCVLNKLYSHGESQAWWVTKNLSKIRNSQLKSLKSHQGNTQSEQTNNIFKLWNKWTKSRTLLRILVLVNKQTQQKYNYLWW